MEIYVTVVQKKIIQDYPVLVPDDVFAKGDQAVKNHLINNGDIENVLDYAESSQEVSFYTNED